jgi:AcrR family transcriptional regulator
MTTVPVEVRRGPGRPRSTNRDEAIVAAAIDELMANGYAGMTIEGVAARAGVAKTTIYRRWAGKDELVLAALSKVKGPLPQPPGTSVRADLTYILEQIRTRWLDSTHGRLMQRLAADGYARPDVYSRFRDQVVRPRQQVTFDVLRRGAERGEIRSDFDPAWVSDVLTSPIIAAVLTHRPRLTKAQAEFCVDVVMSWLERRD